MEKNLVVSCKGPKGGQKISFSEETTVEEFIHIVSTEMGIPPENVCIKLGFPPKLLKVESLTSYCVKVGIKHMESIIISENFEESLFTQCEYKPKEELKASETEKGEQPKGEAEFLKNNPVLKKVMALESQPPNEDGYVMIRREIASDNSCLFNSIGFCMLNDKTKADNLRRIVRKEISSNQEKYKFELDKPFEEYIDWILKPTSWGGALEIYILSQHFGVEICAINICKIDYPTFRVYGEESGYSKRIYILYSGLHYDVFSRNIFEEAEEKTDVKQFDITDQSALEGALFVANDLRKRKQYTDLSDFNLICQSCMEGFKTPKDAALHAQDKGHVAFAESSDYTAP